MYKHSFTTQSRRQVQGRFPPGSLIIHTQHNEVYTLIGWSPVQGTVDPHTGMVKRAGSWEAIIMCDDRIKRLNWTVLAQIDIYKNVDEWEEWITRP